MQNRHVMFNDTRQGQVVSLKKAATIEAAIFDGDGVITNNLVLEGLVGMKPRFRSHYDGQGISLLRALGIRICFITNEAEESAWAIEGLVKRWNSLPLTEKWGEVGLYLGCAGEKKVAAAQKWINANHIHSWERCAVMGDDLVDVPMLREAGLKVAPLTAEFVVRDIVDIVTRRPGGNGAVRDFANFVLEARGIDPTTLPTQ